MPLEVSYTDDGIGTVIRGSGLVTDAEYVEALMTHLRQDVALIKALHYSISDYSNIDGAEITPEAIETVAARCNEVARINPDLVVAIVGPRDLYYGLSRMWESLSDNTGWETLVSRDREEALEWIRDKIARKHGIRDLSFS